MLYFFYKNVVSEGSGRRVSLREVAMDTRLQCERLGFEHHEMASQEGSLPTGEGPNGEHRIGKAKGLPLQYTGISRSRNK